MGHLAGLAQPVDVVLVTGDVTDHGTDAEYAEAVAALGCPYPLLACMGNHDERGAFRRLLIPALAAAGGPPIVAAGAGGLSPGGSGPVDYSAVVGGVTFAMCDSTIPGEDSGRLSDETLDWLDAVLAGGDGPAFVCFHHPPVTVGQPFIDDLRQSGGDRLAAVIARHPRVVATLCGHLHSAAATTFAGRPLLVAPGVASTLAMPWDHRVGTDPAQPPGLSFHLLDDDGRLTTHTRALLL